jgi:hypothetical protein
MDVPFVWYENRLDHLSNHIAYDLWNWTVKVAHPIEIWLAAQKALLNSICPNQSSSLARSGGVISGMGCMAAQPFSTGGNQSYLDFWAITNDPRYPRYKTQTNFQQKIVSTESMNQWNGGFDGWKLPRGGGEGMGNQTWNSLNFK